MAILNILEFPDERLRKKAQPVETVDSAIRRLVSDMFETMYGAPGVGLAATQVNVHKRVIVIDISENADSPLCLINPKILYREGTEESEEGCLSVPGIFEKVTRAERIKVCTLDQQGNSRELNVGGFLAVCIQHEMDHLKGKLFVDYLSPLKRQRIRKKMKKSHRLKGGAENASSPML